MAVKLGVMSTRQNRITVHQFLHGYEDGHRLLASSMSLVPSSQNLMAVLSDLSGPSMVEGFETYVTGYPLPDGKNFALGRTWYANEMKRPGCVWSHTILLSTSDLKRLESIQVVLPHFRRPTPHSETDYKSQLEIATDAVPLRTRDRAGASAAGSILEAFYDNPEKSVLVLSEDSSRYEADVLELWSQLPAVLRVLCAFCTGALAPRSSGGRLLDLQVIPLTAQHSARQIAGALLIRPDQDVSRPPEQWLETLIQDSYSSSKQSPLRVFLERTASPDKPTRATIKPLVQCFDIFSERHQALSADDVVDLLADVFPSIDTGAALKNAALGDSSTLSDDLRILPRFDEGQKLQALARTSKPSAFDADGLRLVARAST